MPEFYTSKIDTKMKHRAPRFRSHPGDWRFSLALDEAATTSDRWHTAENPVGCLIDATWRGLRNRQKADEGEYICASKAGGIPGSLETIEDLEGTEATFPKVSDLAAERIPEILGLSIELERPGRGTGAGCESSPGNRIMSSMTPAEYPAGPCRFGAERS